MEITVYKTDGKGNRTKVVIGKFNPNKIKRPDRKQLQVLLLKSGMGDENIKNKDIGWDIYQEYLDKIQKHAGYSDELLDGYPAPQDDMILLQTYSAWQPSEKK